MGFRESWSPPRVIRCLWKVALAFLSISAVERRRTAATTDEVISPCLLLISKSSGFLLCAGAHSTIGTTTARQESQLLIRQWCAVSGPAAILWVKKSFWAKDTA